MTGLIWGPCCSQNEDGTLNSPSNWAIFSHSLTSPRTALNWGWLTQVTNQRVTLGKGWRKEGSRTCRTNCHYIIEWGEREEASSRALSNLFVHPEHGADDGDISKANPLSNQEGAGAQMLVQHCEDLFHILLGLLCSLQWPTWTNYQALHEFVHLLYSEVCRPKPHGSGTATKLLSTNATWESVIRKYWTANLLVELHDSQSGKNPRTGWRNDLRVSKAHPLQHLSCSRRTGATQLIIAHCRGNIMQPSATNSVTLYIQLQNIRP